jgi:voltage-gated potassium channel Kch
MQIPSSWELIVGSLITLGFGLKLVEVALSTRWVIRHGEVFASELSELKRTWRTSIPDTAAFHALCRLHRRPVQLEEWPVARFLRLAPAVFQRPLVDYVYRFPTLLLLEATFLCLAESEILLAIGIALMLAGLWLEAVHILANRLILGQLDHAYWRTVVVRVWPYTMIQPGELFPSRRRVVRKFVELFGWLLILTLIGYTSIYVALVRTGIGAFEGIRRNVYGIADAFYFSVITLATVGYGDVYPGPEATIARLIVASEVIVGFALIVILLTSFTMTIDEPGDS